MDRIEFLKLLSGYKGVNSHEQEMLNETVTFANAHKDCFSRELLIGHITASAWIINRQMTHALLMHHAKLDRWFQPGGHCDGDPDVRAVAKKEAFEETGLEVDLLRPEIFDIDVHVIPARKTEPEHKHYDIRFLFSADMTKEELDINEEARAVKWIRLEEVQQYNNNDSIMRMVEKTKS
ncbi:MAG: NUDIX hydrolase [Citrobacter freundii]|nr:MAG: NUDIX hydrolase [Citrobacter freundii]